MTPEQKKRIEQIRERQRQRRLNNFHYDVAVAVRDIDFLLSLVKSQEADRHKRRNPYSEECRAAIDELERLFESEEVELCSIDYVHQREDHSATSMRSACVEKVKRYEREHRPNMTSYAHGELKKLISDLLELGSLSIEKPKE